MSLNHPGPLMVVSWCALTLAMSSPAGGQPPAELDAFMEKVLARREINRQTLEQYVLDEREEIEVLGPGRTALYRTRRDFRWYVRDGLHVRSPLRFDGVDVGDEARQHYEDEWSRRERSRLARRHERDRSDSAESPADGTTIVGGVPTPRFVSEAYFLEFKFEPGNYLLAGREQLDGHEVLRIEYYPKRLFSDDDDEKGDAGPGEGDEATQAGRQERRRSDERQRERDTGRRIERQMNKTALVTLWVDPAEHQIVKYTFDNVWMDFLPGAWLVRVDDIHASMVMSQPFPGVWLPRAMTIRGGATLANGSFDATYERHFSDYQQAEVRTKITVPGRSAPRGERQDFRDPYDGAEERPGRGPFVDDGADDQEPERIVELRVHGNAFLPDDAVLELAGVTLGQSMPADGVDGIERRLKASGRFQTVEVRKRFRSLSSTAEVVLVLLVHERPGVTEASPDVRPAARPWQRLRSRLMFLPIVSYADGYGFTYGGRISTVDLLGTGERLSLPLTWGGTRRAALEFERTFERGPLTLIRSSGGISQRENPHFGIDDQRVEVRARAERHVAGVVRTGFEASQSSVEFGTINDPLWAIGADAVLDTRADPAFPRNAVVLGAGWTGLHVRDRHRIDRYTTDARGYLGIFRQIVLAGRVRYTAADATLPPYERLLLGGSETLRGFRTGTFDGDRLLAASAEIRVPITSVLSNARLGLTGFYDAGAAWNFDQRRTDATWHRGAGAGLFLIAPFISLNLDVARGLKTGDTRVHLSSGFAF
ncbi:MAG TPA: BamA/TamA family outer membrane protein [Vicinamibacterales bacterium]|nr:BamA/TamA family outer membrane protein [Vicinamibacterales bacterium]